MKIKWLGHAAFLITTSDETCIVTDPYRPGAFGAINYGPITTRADVVTISHEHDDHNYAAGVPGQHEVVKGTGRHEACGIGLVGVSTFHDRSGGAERGDNTVFIIETDGLRVCHLGDLGHELDAAKISEIGHIDVLLVPVGGTFTLDADAATRTVERIAPKITVPMHFRTPRCALPIAGVEPFLAGKQNVDAREDSEIEVSADTLPATSTVIVLQPAL